MGVKNNRRKLKMENKELENEFEEFLKQKGLTDKYIVTIEKVEE